jgi:hypothetical protein
MTKSAFIVLPLAVCISMSCKKANKDVKSPAPATQTLSSPSPETKEETGLFPARVNGKYGFIDKTGKMVLQPQFSRALRF